jgi:hypothetical protein
MRDVVVSHPLAELVHVSITSRKPPREGIPAEASSHRRASTRVSQSATRRTRCVLPAVPGRRCECCDGTVLHWWENLRGQQHAASPVVT